MKKIYMTLLVLVTYLIHPAQTISFSLAPGSPISNYNEMCTISSDINGDGKADLLVADPNDDKINIFLGNGTGQFTNAPGSPITINSGPIYIAVADFNGDNFPDLATANYFSDNISILLGNGTGAFTSATISPITTNAYPYCIAAADFDLDGNMDLVTCNTNGGDVDILMGDGTGSFSVAAGSPLASYGPYFVVTGLLNSDPYPDFVVANGNGGGSTVNVFLGSGNGTFAPAVTYNAGNQPRTIALSDFNNDGNLDMVIANALSNDVSVYLGSPSGTFVAASGSPITVGNYPFQVVAADFDQNGTQDFAVADGYTNGISVFLGNGTGTFTNAGGSPILVGNDPHPLGTGDFDGDGKVDLVVGDWSGIDVNVLLNKSPRTCSVNSTFIYTSNSTAGLFNFTSTSTGTSSGTSYSWNFGNGFTSPSSSGTAAYTYSANGTYTVTLLANNNSSLYCSSTSSQVITVNLCNLTGGFTFSNSLGAVTCSSSAVGTTTGTTYTWDFGDGSPVSTGYSASHTYSATGSYTISMTANNNSEPACMSTFTESIVVDKVQTTGNVGIQQFQNNGSLSVYPNPTSGQIQISVPGLQAKTEWTLFNVLGQEVLRTRLNATTNTLSLESFKNGIYFYQLSQNGDIIKTGQIVLNK